MKYWKIYKKLVSDAFPIKFKLIVISLKLQKNCQFNIRFANIIYANMLITPGQKLSLIVKFLLNIFSDRWYAEILLITHTKMIRIALKNQCILITLIHCQITSLMVYQYGHLHNSYFYTFINKEPEWQRKLNTHIPITFNTIDSTYYFSF